MRNIAVIGAGQMGTGIAQTVAAHGMNVMLSDIDLATAEAGKGKIDNAVTKLVGRGKIEADAAETLLSKITPVADYAPMVDADLIIEAPQSEKRSNSRFLNKRAKSWPPHLLWRPTPVRSRSRAWQTIRQIRNALSACTFLILCRLWA